MRYTIRALPLLIVIAFASVAQAQSCPAAPTSTVVAPKKLCLVASPDHNTMDLGVPVVSGYTYGYCDKSLDPATCQPQSQIDLGKPTPNGQGAIWIDTTAGGPLLFGTPLGGEFRPVIIVRGEDAGLFARYPAGAPFGQPMHQAPRVPATGAVPTP